MAIKNGTNNSTKKDRREEDLKALLKPQKAPFQTPGTNAKLEADLMDIYREPQRVKNLDTFREDVNRQGAGYMDTRYGVTSAYRDALKQQQALQAGGGTAMETYQNAFKNNNVTVTPNSFGSYWDRYQNAIKNGYFDEGDDYTKWSPKKVDDRIKELQEQIANITNLQTGALTEEEKAKKKELDDLWALKGKNTPIWSMDLGKQVTGRPQGGQNQSEYDKALYDQIHGDGAFDRRVGELKTKADIDAFKRDIDELWDRFENVPTPDGLQASKQELSDIWGQKGKYTALDMGEENIYSGKYGEIPKKPEDYYYGNMREEYDKLLYDDLYGDGAYEKRVNELTTDASVDAFETEMDDLWARYDARNTGIVNNPDSPKLYQIADKNEELNKREAELNQYFYGQPKMEKELKDLQNWSKLGNKVSELEAGAKGAYEKKDTTGQFGKGNIDLNNRKVVHNEDGSISTVRSFTANFDGKEVLLPTVIDGKIVSEEEAIDHYLKTGEYLGMFDTVEEADEYAQILSDRQDWYYHQPGLAGNEVQGDSAANNFARNRMSWLGVTKSAWESDNMGQIYLWIQQGQEQNQLPDVAEDPLAAQRMNPYRFMTPEQVQTFNDYFHANDLESAKAYIDALRQYYINPAQSMYEQMAARQGAEGPLGAVYGIGSIFEKPKAGFMGTMGSVLALTGNDEAAQASSEWYTLQGINDATRAGRTEAWGQTAEDLLGAWARKPAEFLNGVFYSMADMTMAAGLGSAAFPSGSQAANVMTQFIMSSEAASATMREQLEQHRDPTEAALRSIGAGAIEWITEKYSIEQLLNPNVKEMLRSKKGLASFIAKNTIAEGSEEGASDVLNIALDVILGEVYGHENEIEEAYNKYRAQGMSEEEASNAVLWDNLLQIGTDMLAGSLSGFLMSGSRVGMNAVGMKSEGRNIKSGSNTTAEGVTGIDQVLQLSLGMKEGTQSRALAEEIQKKIESGKTPTDFEMGRLAQLTAVEAGEQQEALVRDSVERTIRESITKQGVPAQEAAQYSAIITGSLMEGKSLTKEQMSVLSQSEPAMNVWKSYNTRTGATALGMEARKAAAPSQSIINRLGDLTGQTNYGNSVIAAEIVRSSRETNSPAEAIDNLAQRRSDLMSEDFAKVAKEVLQSDKKIVNKARFLDDAMKIRLAAMTLNDNLPANGMSAESAQKLYDAARKEFDAIDEQRIRQQVQVKPGEGWAKFNGAEYGTAAFDEAIAGQNRQLRNQMRMIGEVATRMGSRVTFINDEDNPGIFGYEQSDGSITVNIAGKHRSGMSHHMMVTLSHEMTHWLEQNSREGYNQLRKFVLDSLRAKGTNIEQLIVSSIDNQNAVLGADSGESLTINGAMAEIVARSCENLLSSQAMADELAKTNPSLYTKVKNFVKNFVARMREAVKGMNSSLSYEARALLNETEKIAKIWLGAREEALGRETPEGTEDISSEVLTSYSTEQLSEVLASYTMDQLDDAYMNAVKEGNEELLNAMVQEAARRNGYTTPKLYHGTESFGFTEFDFERGEGTVFSTPNKELAEAYSKERPSRKIKDKVNYEALKKLNGQQLLQEAKKQLKGYEDYRLLTKEEKEQATQKIKEVFIRHLNSFENFIRQNSLNEEQKSKAKDLVNSLSKIAEAESSYDAFELWMDYNSKARAITNGNDSKMKKMLSEETYDEIFKAHDTLLKAWYDGDIYISKDNLNEIKQDRDIYWDLVDELSMGIYELYGKPGRQLTIEGDGSKWNKLTAPEELGLDGKQDTRDIAWAAKRHNYDSVLLKDVRDDGRKKDFGNPTDIYIFFGESQVKSADPVTYDDKGEVIKLSERFNPVNPDIRYSTEQLDAEYQAAVEHGDLQRATDMLMDRLAETEGIIPFNAPHGYGGQHKDIAKLIKEGTPEAVARAAADMARFVPENGVLIPMPPHEGTVKADTDTMILANAIGKLTGRPVVVALESDPRESRYKAKSEGRKGVSAAEMGFRQVEEIPEGSMPIFVDNVVGSGVTADAARTAMGGGITLAYAKGTQSKGIEGLKRATVTYDRDGKLIPLSQRFDRSIRNVNYSTEQMDDAYQEAIDSGDVETQQRMVDAAAKQAGYTKKVYHGTPNGGFTVFKDWSFFTENKEYADRYQNPSASSVRGYYNGQSNPSTYGLYMNEGRVFDTRKKAAKDLYNKIRLEQGMGELDESGLPDWVEARDLIDYIEENDLPYDTILLDEGADGGYGEEVRKRGISYVTRNNRVKSADPVTYDDNGNVIPLSERFNRGMKDIRFSMEQAIEERDDGLVAVHNLTYENLMDTLAEGGFTAPSIAVIRTKTGHTKYGNISVVFKKNAIDPVMNRLNKVYGADAYTPTRYNAHVETELSYDKLNKAADDIAKYVKGMDEHLEQEVRRWFSERAYREVTTKTPQGLAEEAYNNEALMAAYLKSKGQEVPLKTRERFVNQDLRAEDMDTYQKAAQMILDNADLMEFIEDVGKLSGRNLIEKYGEIIAPANERIGTLLNIWKEKNLDIAGKSLMHWMKRIRDFLQGGSEKITEPDWYETRKAMWDIVDKNDYVNWLAGKLAPAFGQKGIRNNLDPYTYAGNARTFKQLHMPYTIENVVKAMYTNAQEKGQNGRYAKGVAATSSKEYANLQEVKEDADRLRIEDEAVYEATWDELDTRMRELGEEIMPDAADYFDEVLMTAGRNYAKSQTIRAIQQGFAKEQYQITKEQAEKVKALLDDIREVPTGYFEAKPMRVVGFDEVEKVIMPANDIMEKKLKDAGVRYEIYDGTEEDRLEKLNNDKSYQFSIEDAPDMDVNAWMAGLTPGSLQTEDERALHQAWKDLRMSFSLSIKRQLDYRAKIKRLESLTNPTKEERADLVALRNRLQDQEENQARLEKKIAEVTSKEGFAGMMYEHNMRLKDTIAGRTQDEVNNTVEDMMHEVQKMAQEIAEAKRELEKIAEQEGVKQAEAFLKKTQLGEYAKSLKKDYRSKMTEGEIRSRMAEMALRIAQGETVDDILDSASELAYDLARMQTGYQGAYGDAAERLKKATIVIGQTQYEQLRAQHSSIPELRRQLAGTGVKIVYDKNLRGAGTLEDIGPGSEIHDLLPELGDDTGNMMDNLDKFLSVARSIRENIEKEMIHDFDLQDATDMIRGFAMLGAAEMKGNPAMATHIRRLLGLQKADGGKAGELAERLANAQAYMGNALEKGDIAKGLTRMLKKDVDSAIDYYNKIAAVAAKEEKRKVREGLIKQLKSEHGQALLREQMKWRDLIEKDKTVREKMASNHQLRQWITTDYSRIRKLLINETDQKNIPEHMKSLARQMLKMLTENDMLGRKITTTERADLKETLRVLDAMKETDAEFTIDDLKAINDEEVQAAIADALADLEDGIKFYNASPGSDRISNLQAFHNALDRIHGAVDTIYSVIKAQQSISFMDRQILVADAAEDIRRDMGKSRFKGELKGRGSKAIRTAKNAVVYGNMTPVYFIKNLLNKGMDEQWKEIERGENQYGLEAQKAETYVADLAERTGYSSWSNQKLKVTLGGNTKTISIENAMELYAIWRREQTTNPEMSQHMTKGGVVINEEEETGGKLQREHKEMRPIRVTDGEILAMYDQLTDEQKAYIEGMVKYLSNDMSELGNAASMRMYGIKKYKEKYYFPMKVWDGVKSARSDKGISGTDENRAAHKSWSKRRQNLARNALVIGSFTQDAVNHIVEMITYNTMAPAIENLNRVLNFQFTEGMTEDDITKRNLRIMFAENYGKDALNYLETFMNDLNGGAVQDQRKTLRDRMLAIFKKNAVAGSLSVALQQPLSYVRAAMMINPKYLAQAISPQYWKGSYEEMNKYSGVAVIKNMGRFDMNFGQSAVDYIMPEGAKTKGRAAYEWLSDKSTKLPELADRMTWTRMWSAVKLEQAAQNPGMDVKSDEFLQKCAERFNDVMRKTQVYDSVLVKSSNMRSQNLGMKVMTSFMAEPTLTLNVLADAVRNVNLPGGKAVLAKAGATYVLSAVFQALVKARMGTGRSPDKKKTIEENMMNKFMQSFMGEVNPMSLIPGYSDLIEVLKTGELQDDAMGALGKLKSVVDTTQKAIQGKQDDVYRGLEDTVGQLAQLFTNIPAKNLMRDARAMWNWAVVRPYADRATSGAVLKEQSMANFMTGDNLLGVLNSWLGDAGYKTTNASYYDRMMQAREAGDAEREDELHEYLTLARGVTDKTISQEMRKRMKASSVLTPEEKIKQLREDGMKDTDIANWIVDEYEAGNLTKTEAEKLYVQANPKKDANDAYFMFERKEQEKETGESVTGGDYYKLDAAIAKGDTAAATAAAKDLTAHGYTSEDVNDHAKDYITKKYRAGEITNAQAKQALKTFRKDLDDVDIFWMLDRIDYKNETGKSAGSGKYYRLDAAIEANKANEITRAVNDMLKYGGYDKEGVLKGIRYFKKTYLAAEGNEKIKLRDALTKAFKAAGMSATEATKEIDSWKPAKTKKKKTK